MRKPVRLKASGKTKKKMKKPAVSRGIDTVPSAYLRSSEHNNGTESTSGDSQNSEHEMYPGQQPDLGHDWAERGPHYAVSHRGDQEHEEGERVARGVEDCDKDEECPRDAGVAGCIEVVPVAARINREFSGLRKREKLTCKQQTSPQRGKREFRRCSAGLPGSRRGSANATGQRQPKLHREETTYLPAKESPACSECEVHHAEGEVELWSQPSAFHHRPPQERTRTATFG